MASSSSSSSDFSSGEITVPPKQRKGPPYIMLVPLIYAPVLPLIRIGFRHNPVLRDRLFYGVLAGAFAHGAYLIIFEQEIMNSKGSRGGSMYRQAQVNWKKDIFTYVPRLPYDPGSATERENISEIYDIESK